MKERVGDEKLIIISVAVRGINDHIWFYSQKTWPTRVQNVKSLALAVAEILRGA